MTGLAVYGLSFFTAACTLVVLGWEAFRFPVKLFSWLTSTLLKSLLLDATRALA